MVLIKYAVLGTAIVLALLALVPVVVTWVVNSQARDNDQRLRRPLATPKTATWVAVTVFSRSGKTAVLARHLAEQLQADLYRLEAEDYALGLVGWVRAMLDARKEAAVITPASIELSRHETVYLGSPIWLYSPAPPIWQFVEKNCFEGKHVALFSTFNSQFKQEYIDAFRQRVLDKGAKPFAHRAVWRGRMGR